MGKKTLSMDLRMRAVEAHDNGEGTLQEIADRFCIGRTTLCDLLRLRRKTGSLEPSKVRGHNPKRIDSAGQERLRALVAAQPDATYQELTEHYNAEATVPVSRAAIVREVLGMKLTRKKRPSGPKSATRRPSKPGDGTSKPGPEA